jgi:hypothetical protein
MTESPLAADENRKAQLNALIAGLGEKENPRIKGLRDWIDVVFKLLITGMVGFGTWYLTSQKQGFEAAHTEKVQQNDDVRLVVDMLATDDAVHRTMALSIAKAYAVSRIPAELFEAVNAYVSSKNNRIEAQQTNAVIAQVQTSTAGTQVVRKANDSLPIRIYIQYQRIEDKAGIEAIRQKLNSQAVGTKTINVPPIEHVATTISAPVLKCFRQSECDAFGKTLVDKLKAAGAPANLQLQPTPGSENSTTIRPNHFEAWFGSL